MDLKSKILSYSNQFSYYKNNYEKSQKEIKSLKTTIKSLEMKNNELFQINNELKKDNDLFNDLLIHRENFNEENFCPICGKFSKFNPFGIRKRPKAQCRHCHSLERDRLTFLIFENRLNEIFNRQIKLLHFAPEKLFYNMFTKNQNIDYYPVDINPEMYENRNIKIKEKVNMEEIPFNDEEFDLIYNSHVLEHVPDDNKALKELYRVLKNDGICLIIIPLSKLTKTLENKEYSTPELRLKYYGQEDHLRMYGLDFKDKLESIGFNVEEITPESIVTCSKDVELFSLKMDKLFTDGVYLCTK